MGRPEDSATVPQQMWDVMHLLHLAHQKHNENEAAAAAAAAALRDKRAEKGGNIVAAAMAAIIGPK
ncbi:hypothetical protein DUNSADRAFT_13579 [Dunaliella salina]|uniref:Encoded protein n=1 Tax=Dunaliella salina TaxID=3046 RepID=A0ABQ7H3B8_DUNSA|nr:hypothetical protein DUNSADRAFT_13579 [Dunaliella salina]|eukprot:KAF5841306.1 hypothetical protein DUNSADRAFT_13579 [Dunaliella salina]